MEILLLYQGHPSEFPLAFPRAPKESEGTGTQDPLNSSSLLNWAIRKEPVVKIISQLL